MADAGKGVQPELYLGDLPVCPRCNQRFQQQASGGLGSFYLTCDNKTAESKRCGQTSHLVAVEGIIAVVPISKEQFRRFRRMCARTSDIYIELGIITRPRGYTGPYDPEHACLSCGAMTSVRDLYAGECRSCHDADGTISVVVEKTPRPDPAIYRVVAQEDDNGPERPTYSWPPGYSGGKPSPPASAIGEARDDLRGGQKNERDA